jgi:ATP-dependent RNA helicase DeaD
LTTFKELGLSSEVLKALSELGFESPTEIQQQAVPQLLEGHHDFIGLAQTGTGKTAAFGLPLLERIDTSIKATQALVLAPTRELGQQIAEQLEKFSKHLDKVNVLAVYGGAAISNQMRALRNTQHVIIATPGRLIDLIERKAIKLDQLKFLVLDEADEMLNMGFKDELDKILSYTPESKMTWLFSATMPAEIKRIVKKYMDDPIEAKVSAKNEVNANIEHQYVVVKQNDKEEALTRFLDLNPNMRGLVFCRTKRDTQNLAEVLLNKNYKADALHGDLSQMQRDRVMKRFKSHDLHVLIATDVAARGIDVNDLTHVFHYTLPDDNSYYTHRSGRTARAGKKGISIAFINSREGHKINRLAKSLGIEISRVMIPSNDDIHNIRFENWCQLIMDIDTKGKIDSKILAQVNTVFGSLTKEELIEKMVIDELNKLNLGASKDLNVNPSNSRDRDDRPSGRRDERRGERRGERRDDKRTDSRRGDRDSAPRERRDRKVVGERRERTEGAERTERKPRSANDKPRFFINLGERDKVSKHDLMDFVCRISGIQRSSMGEVNIQKSFSFFEVDPTVEKKITNKFNNITLEDGRELRVNRDN